MDSDFENLKKQIRGAAEGQKNMKNGTCRSLHNFLNLSSICLKFLGFAHRYQSYNLNLKKGSICKI